MTLSTWTTMVNRWMPGMEDLDTVRLSILICLRVKTMVTRAKSPVWFSVKTVMVYSGVRLMVRCLGKRKFGGGRPSGFLFLVF